MEDPDEMRKRLDALQREYRSVYSMLSMMEKGTKPEDLKKMQKEQLEPIKMQIQDLEADLKKLL